MKVTATRDVFTYDELTPDAQRNALTNLCADAWECLDSDMVAEDLAGYFTMLAAGADGTVLSRKQLETDYGVRIYWSVAYSQSDHASIEGKLNRSDTPNLAWPEGVTYARVSSRNYGGSRVECIETDDDAYIEHGDLYDATQEMITKLNGKLYRYARQQVEAYTSEEYVLDAYRECYELTRRFTEHGDVVPAAFWQSDDYTETTTNEGDK
jgi:hypothetical protein